MSDKKKQLLLLVLLALLGLALARLPSSQELLSHRRPAEGRITGFQIKQAAGDHGLALDVSYFLRNPHGRTRLAAYLWTEGDTDPKTPYQAAQANDLVQGNQARHLRLNLPPQLSGSKSLRLRLELLTADLRLTHLEQRIERHQAVMPDERGAQSIRALLDEADAALEAEPHDEARELMALAKLKRQGEDAPSVQERAQLQVALARFELRSDSGLSRLIAAERRLHAALTLQPELPLARLQLARIATERGRWQEANRGFGLAAADMPDQTSVWLHWADLKSRQGHLQEAQRLLETGITRSVGKNGQQRSISLAYSRLLQLFREAGNRDAELRLLRQRAGSAASDSCAHTELALFELQVLGKAELVDRLSPAGLPCEELDRRELKGLGAYLRWARTDKHPESALLQQARAQFPWGPKLLVRLVSSPHLLPIADSLHALGQDLEAKDADELTALALALKAGDAESVERLLKLGASAHTLVSTEYMPVAFLPVVYRDLKSIQTLRRLGVDFRALRYRGLSAHAYAKSSGDRALLRALR